MGYDLAIGDGEYYDLVLSLFEKVPFQKQLGLKPKYFSAERCEFTLSMKDELVGNWVTGILHGGAIATALDVVGGAVVFLATRRHIDMQNVSLQDQDNKIANVGTIDMRIDYLHPGKGKEFIASATLLRAGNKVAVTRMAFHNENGLLIATATGTYLCG